MKHEDVVTALKTVAEKGTAANISADDQQNLIKFNLISISTTEKKAGQPVVELTKKGRVMLKANSK